MIITDGQDEHAGGIDAVNRASFSVFWSRGLIEEDLKNPNSFYAVAAADGEISGYASMTVIAGEANLTNIAVMPKFRRGGVGEALLSRLLDVCVQRGCFLITLEVRKSNIGAIALYEKKGFVSEGERKRYYSDNGEDALIMTKRF